MLLNPRTPLIIGTVLIFLLGALVTVNAPMPNQLSATHGSIEGMSTLASCSNCHDESGVGKACLNCHTEIASQLNEKSGYHHFLLGGKEVSCAGCHGEHFGTDFPLVSKLSWGAQSSQAFKHPHVQFDLTGKHARLECQECHVAQRDDTFSLPSFPNFPRKRSFLGLNQDCISCHEDIHSDGLSSECSSCHGQEVFRPTTEFQHDTHFPLKGGHEQLPCSDCHVLPHPDTPKKPMPFPFDKVQGTTCVECHNSPHHAPFTDDCSSCHDGTHPQWRQAITRMTTEKHAATGFPLTHPHDRVSCDRCHPSDLPFSERHPDPTSPGYQRRPDMCRGCHEDVHRGQFSDRYGRCLDCHDSHSFLPTLFSHDDHAKVYELTGSHAATACVACHTSNLQTHTRQFVGTTRECKLCHKNPHGDQFHDTLVEGDCDACHGSVADTFSIRPFDHDRRTSYPLKGAHAKAECNDCHVEILTPLHDTSALVRRYKKTPTECSSCHKDAHYGQFTESGQENCSRCHASTESWKETIFDHNTQARFSLEGVHAKVECSRCHMEVALPNGGAVVQYKPIGRVCGDCHEIPEDAQR